ncbi:MAG: response regulator transcription factor, partial [Candidatus Hydrogenedentes bacterium]|nr:response regulator transcription factor [Candidatus Hydrogenedentota bacterium]
MKVLVAEDDANIRAGLIDVLENEGYHTVEASTGEEALEVYQRERPDFICLDIMMPGIDGIEVSKRLRQASDVSILMLTAKGTVADKVAGLESGADDYLVKPFAFDELLARVRALLRRHQPSAGETLRFSDLSLNTATREVKRGNQFIELTAQEFDLLELFMRHPRQVLKRDLIYERVWGYTFEGESNV